MPSGEFPFLSSRVILSLMTENLSAQNLNKCFNQSQTSRFNPASCPTFEPLNKQQWPG